jgi:hypothetical protein
MVRAELSANGDSLTRGSNLDDIAILHSSALDARAIHEEPIHRVIIHGFNVALVGGIPNEAEEEVFSSSCHERSGDRHVRSRTAPYRHIAAGPHDQVGAAVFGRQVAQQHPTRHHARADRAADWPAASANLHQADSRARHTVDRGAPHAYAPAVCHSSQCAGSPLQLTRAAPSW